MDEGSSMPVERDDLLSPNGRCQCVSDDRRCSSPAQEGDIVCRGCRKYHDPPFGSAPAHVALAEVLELLEKRAQIEAPNAAAALRWAARLAIEKWDAPEQSPPKPEMTFAISKEEWAEREQRRANAERLRDGSA